MMHRQKVLLFGGSGFIGKNISPLLRSKYHLLTPSHKQVDVTHTKAIETYLQKTRPNIVINAASVGTSYGNVATIGTLNQDVRIFFNIVRCQKYYGRLINIGSGAEYDKHRPLVRVSEKAFGQAIPIDDYGLAKFTASVSIDKMDNAVNLRLFGIFGPHENYRHRFISNAICRNIFDMPIAIRQDVVFDYLFIDDLVPILEYFISTNPRYKQYNVGSGQPITLTEIARKINSIALKPSKIIVKNPNLQNEYSCDTSRLMKEVPNLSFTDIDDSLATLYQWYKRHKNHIDKRQLYRRERVFTNRS